MNSMDTFRKRLRDATATVEQEIQSHSQQVKELSKRLEGLKRAVELFESDQAAIAELLQASMVNGGAIAKQMATALQAKKHNPKTSRTAIATHQQLGGNAQVGRGRRMATGDARAARQKDGLTRVDMLLAVLRRHPRRTVRELITLLNQEYQWSTTESAITGLLYTRRDKFAHTQPDRSSNRPVTWSLK